jgi:hypothetical protein
MIALLLVLTAQAAAPPAADAPAKARCSQLIAYYDRFAVGRSGDSDGRRNHTRMGAEIDCARGHYAKGIAVMETLLRNKKFTPPAPGPNVVEDDD